MSLKTYLDSTGEKPSAFARRTKTTAATISRILSEDMRPGIDLAHRIEVETGGAVPMSAWAGFVPRKNALKSDNRKAHPTTKEGNA